MSQDSDGSWRPVALGQAMACQQKTTEALACVAAEDPVASDSSVER